MNAFGIIRPVEMRNYYSRSCRDPDKEGNDNADDVAGGADRSKGSSTYILTYDSTVNYVVYVLKNTAKKKSEVQKRVAVSILFLR